MASEAGIRCIVGLGNPGDRYAATRHNAGFWFVDETARRHGALCRGEAKFFGEVCRLTLDGADCWLLKPMTYMNRSGQSVSAFLRFYKLVPEDLLVVHDELDLQPGTARLKQGGGHGGHNGLRDITSALGGNNFLRLRLGIGHPGYKDGVVDYVLERPSRDDETAIADAIDRAARVLPELVAGEIQRAMNVLHSSDN
jgi:peptidyl-tRNA hydrolase, PTH1 family